MNGNQFNIYTPLYLRKKDSTQIKTSILKWCNDIFHRVSGFDVEKADEMLKSAFNLTDSESDEIHFMNEITLKNATVDLIQSNEFTFRNVVVNKEKIDRVNALKKQSDFMRKDIGRLKQKIDFVDATTRTRRQAIFGDNLIELLTVNGSLNIQSINGIPIQNLVYMKNIKNQNLKSIVARQIVAKNEFFVRGKVDGIEMAVDNIILNIPRQILRPISLEKLTVKNINPINVNGMNFNEFFSLLERKFNLKLPNLIHELDVEFVKIQNLLNGQNITEIAINALKSSGSQLFLAPLQVKNLKVKDVNFDSSPERISDIPISNLIDISDSKTIEILQDIRFVQPLEVNQLFVKERINNVNIKDGKLLILRTDGVEEQTVTGEKQTNSLI